MGPVNVFSFIQLSNFRVYIFTDMNSTNGTTVNGYKMEANETVSVKEGDTVQIAGLSYRFRES